MTSYLNVLACGVDSDNALMMNKVQPELTGIRCGILVALNQLVTVLTRTFEAAFHVGARLVAETPFFAFVSVCCRCQKNNNK